MERAPSFAIVNRRPEECFPGGYRFYDEGVAAFEAGEDFNPHASRSWRDGYKDAQESVSASPSAEQ